jgi:hypothetical protein
MPIDWPAENGIEVEFLCKRNVRKEDRVKTIRGRYASCRDGGLLDLRTVAQQEHRKDVSAARIAQLRVQSASDGVPISVLGCSCPLTAAREA